jgi:hypothetical protein
MAELLDTRAEAANLFIGSGEVRVTLSGPAGTPTFGRLFRRSAGEMRRSGEKS